MAERIEITFTPEGEARVEAKEFSGPDCEKFTRAFEEAIGDVTERKRTADYGKRPAHKVRA